MTSEPRTDGLITKEQACINARRVLDAARERRDGYRARGVLPPQVEFMLRRIEHEQRTQSALDGPEEDAVLLYLAARWTSREGTAPQTSLLRLAKATGVELYALRNALAHLTTASEVKLSCGSPPVPANPMDVAETARFELRADWHLINHRRPRPQAHPAAE
ncbi:DUF6042 family protein [Streptomyces racemochromogenes]|uniref:DUF6042 family protein n=1 Tax=Streptomyces racemochromogenes TaxID=67353 RepID=A0ABW7PI10_9ACTN